MTDYSFGNYGFLQQGKMGELPVTLLDMGVERRRHETYRYENSDRAPYGGYLLQYTLNGCGIYETADRTYELTPGRGFLSRMPEDSRYYLSCAEMPENGKYGSWDFFYLHFDGPAVPPFFETIRKLTGPVFSLAPTKPPVHLFFQLFDKCRRKEPSALYENSEFLYRFLIGLLRELETPSGEGSALVRQAAAYFRNHFATIRGIGEAAESCQVSQEYLTRAFRSETEQTPLQYLTRLRIEHGLFLLLNTQDSIEKIAAACGFLNGNYFAKVFRKFLQCSPEEYRRRNR